MIVRVGLADESGVPVAKRRWLGKIGVVENVHSKQVVEHLGGGDAEERADRLWVCDTMREAEDGFGEGGRCIGKKGTGMVGRANWLAKKASAMAEDIDVVGM